MSKVEHTTIRNNSLFCLNCGGNHPLNMPVAINEMTKKIDAFNVLHKDCKKTWTEPKAIEWLMTLENLDKNIWECAVGGGSAVAYAWFVWQKGFTGKTTIEWFN